MYKVVIIDDEKFVISELENFIPWEKMGFSVVGTATDGNSGFELIKELNPHVVITDICMPYCLGTEMMQRIKESGIKTKIIVLSGYDEFEYVRSALDAGAVNYLLKPVKFEELNTILEKIKKEYQLEEAENEKKYKAFAALYDTFIIKLTKGIIRSRQEIFNQAEELNLDFPTQNYSVFIIELDNLEKLKKESDSKEIEEIIQLVKMQSLGAALCYGEAYIAVDENEQILLVFGSRNLTVDLIKNIAVEIKYEINQISMCTCTVSVGDVVNSIEDIADSYKSALMTSETKFMLGGNRILFSSEYDSSKKHKRHSFISRAEKNEDRLLVLFKSGSTDEVFEIIDEVFKSVFDKDTARKEYYAFLKIIERFTVWNGFEIASIVDDNFFNTYMLRKESLQDMVGDLKAIYTLAFDYIRQAPVKSSSLMVQEVINYVQKNYNKNVSLEEIGKTIHVHPAYLSSVFKKETGKNFVKYLMWYRMEIAKELLKDMSLKTYAISEMVGYYSSTNFTAVFKEIVGTTPKEYRNSIVMRTKMEN